MCLVIQVYTKSYPAQAQTSQTGSHTSNTKNKTHIALDGLQSIFPLSALIEPLTALRICQVRYQCLHFAARKTQVHRGGVIQSRLLKRNVAELGLIFIIWSSNLVFLPFICKQRWPPVLNIRWPHTHTHTQLYFFMRFIFPFLRPLPMGQGDGLNNNKKSNKFSLGTFFHIPSISSLKAFVSFSILISNYLYSGWLVLSVLTVLIGCVRWCQRKFHHQRFALGDEPSTSNFTSPSHFPWFSERPPVPSSTYPPQG